MAYRAKTPAVYMLASKRNGTIYTGVTSDLYVRMPQHKQGLIEGFTKKYHVHMLVYYEMHHLMTDAIRREHRIKEWRRRWKIRLIESMNPEWIDLFDERTGEILDGPADVGARAERDRLPRGAWVPALSRLLASLASGAGMTQEESALLTAKPALHVDCLDSYQPENALGSAANQESCRTVQRSTWPVSAIS